MTGWQDIEAEVLRRIQTRDWPPGSAIPNEADLATDFGVARATVNRALQSLAEAGWIERRRRAGSRVALHPVRKATFAIPVIRAEVVESGRVYAHRLILRETGLPPADVAFDPGPHLHLVAQHLADGAVHAHEDRWINRAAVPGIDAVDLAEISANEWLVGHAPFTHGDYAVAARQAGDLAPVFGCDADHALVTVRRGTWNGAQPITVVTLTFAPGHVVRAAL